MPQMAPINWLLMFTLFSALLLIWNNMNFFYKINKPQSISSLKKNISNSWMW
uniref:ATP synthase F0 subunit 8 n=1 Tax=Adiscus speciosus TaxID=2978449 RepID=UPI0021CC7388|nr:ATP synthase F0 subunit 8 [Adiscus speciosus]UWV18187.1 ATP synthase F0 subunit 8 [Adiscus speciosus]